MPVLIMTPLISADTWEGAAGWASGSQMCSGTSPALVPKPTRASRKMTEAAEPPADSVEKESDSPLPSSKNITSKKAVPMWVATR